MVFLLKFLVTTLAILTFVRFRPLIVSTPIDVILRFVLIAGLVSLGVFIVLNLMKQSKREKQEKAKKQGYGM